jgi:hypothetical protein
MKIIYIFFCVFFVGCINVKKELKISDTIDYNELNIFISDSLPILVDFDENTQMFLVSGMKYYLFLILKILVSLIQGK